MTDPAAGLSVLHVVVRASETNSQYNEHCLPVREQRRIVVCSLFPAAVAPPPEIGLFEGDGSVVGCFRALRAALTSRRFDIVHVHAAASAVVTLLVYRHLRRPRRDLVFTIHNSWQNFRPRNRLLLWLVAAGFPVLVVCGAAAHATVPRGVRWIARRLEVIPNGVDVDRVDAVLRSSGPVDRDRRPGSTVVAVNRLIPIKNPEIVMEAFVRAAGPQDTLVMIGDGSLSSRLSEAVREVDLEDQVHLTGPVPREEVYQHLRSAAVFVSASAGEGLPVAVLEAMACRCPVVLSDIPPHREIARQAPAVTLVDIADVDGFADAIRRALRRASFGRYLVGDELRRAVESHFSVTRMNIAYGRVYHSVAEANALRHGRAAPGTTTEPARRRPAVTALLAAAVAGAVLASWYAGSRAPDPTAATTLALPAPDPAASANQVRARNAGAAGLVDMAGRQVVLEPVATRLRVADWRSLRPRVGAQLVKGTSIEVTATGSTAQDAERLAAAVADRLVTLTDQRSTPAADKAFVDRELARLQAGMTATQRQIDAQLARSGDNGSGAAALELAALREHVAQLQRTYRSMLDWRADAEASRGLAVVDPATVQPPTWLRSQAALATAGGVGGPLLLLALSTLVAAARQEQRRAGQDSDREAASSSSTLRLVGSLHTLSSSSVAGPR